MSYKPVDGSGGTGDGGGGGGVRDAEGAKYFAEAEKTLKTKSSWMKNLVGLGDDSRYENAAQLYVKAANAYKLGKSWKKAGESFVKAAECYSQTPNGTYDAATKYMDAAKAFKNGHVPLAIKSMEKALAIYEDLGRFSQCAKINKELAEIYESTDETDKAIERYTMAADFYEGEDAKSNANSCRVKIAELSALAEKYPQAIELYESVAQAALDSNLLRYGAKEHLLRAGMCHLCLGDDVGASRALQRYSEIDPSFRGSREHKLLQGIVEAVENGDVEAFTNTVYEFDSIATLDPWKTKILLRIKNGLKSNEEDLT
mmetsp:Transcript_28670/g.111923  ORF Transcript_28670/g.111923 Transcript_28670/m.111923 type:complete len:315 (-) Transcript_28670:266-1210(-)